MLLINYIHIEKAPLNANTILELNSCRSYQENRTFSSSVNAQEIPVLVYHRIVRRKHFRKGVHIDEKGRINSTVVPYENFSKQMAYLYDNDYTTLTLNEFHNWIKNKKKVPPKSVLITFDDGFKNNYNNVYPILKKYGFRASVFVITGKLREVSKPFIPENAQYLSLQDIQASCDLINYQSHTYNNHNVNKYEISSLITKPPSFVVKDLQTSIRNLNSNHLAFAYPYGQYDDESLRIIEGLFDMAFTTSDSTKNEKKANTTSNLYKISRYTIYPTTTMNEFVNIVSE